MPNLRFSRATRFAASADWPNIHAQHLINERQH
jgi:hypothetical protein